MPQILINVPENFLYQLLPPVVLQLDTQKLIQAVVGGYQDRVADLRSYGNSLSNLNSPTAVNYGQVFATYIGDAGQTLTVTLDADETTPTSPGPALNAWAFTQMNLDATIGQSVLNATLGVDPLREVNVNVIQLLAQNLGAVLYPGSPTELPAQTLARQQNILSTYFPRLKVKGSPVSFVAAAKLAGYDEAAMVPQWSRLSPRTYSNSLFNADVSDFPDYWPTADLPDPFYNPLNYTDGPYYTWNSGTVVLQSGTNFILDAVNQQNPFITLAEISPGTINPLPAGNYVLSGGAPQQAAQAVIAAGTVSSGLVATALVPGAGFNGVRITVLGNGTAPQLEILGPLSTIKYRSSYFNFYAWHSLSDSGSVPVGPSPDLQAGLVTPDGPSVAPWLPWTGGSAPQPTVSLWPTKTYAVSGTSTSRYQASGTVYQLDSATEQESGQRVFGILGDVQPATRYPAQLSSGYITYDNDQLAPYLSVYVLTTGTGVFNGQLVAGTLPYGPLTATFYQSGVPLETESDGGQGLIFNSLPSSGGSVTGSYYLPANTWTATVTSPGTVTAQFLALNKELPQALPTVAAEKAGLATYTNRATGTVSVMFGTVIGTNIFSGTLSSSDVYPWRAVRELAGGDMVQSQVFTPFNGDPALNPQASPSLFVSDSRSVFYQANVLTYAGSQWPPQLSFVENDALVRTQAVAQVSNGTALVPIIKVGNTLMSKSMWDLPHTQNLVAYIPFTENPNDPLAASEAFGIPTTCTNFFPSDRVFQSSYGWSLGLTSGQLYANIAGSAVGFRMMVGAPNPLGVPKLLNLGALNLTLNGTTLAASLTGGAQTGTIPLIPGWSYVEADTNGSTVNLNVIPSGAAPVTLSGTSSGTVSLGSGLNINAATPLCYLQDMCVWTTARTAAQLATLATPPIPATSLPTSQPYVTSPYGDRYALQLQPQSGFAFVGAQSPTIDYRGLQSTISRYKADGGYSGDPEFKRVGLGGLQQLPAVYQLGLQGVRVPATGALITGGTWPGLPGFTQAWNGTTSGTIYSVVPPYSPTGGVTVATGTSVNGTGWAPNSGWAPLLPQYNGVTSHIYVKGDVGSVYECYLDNLGTGPQFFTKPAIRNVTPSSLAPNGFEIPTDNVVSYQVGTYALGVNVNGQVYAANAAASTGSYIPSQPLYMYMNDQVVSSAPNALSAWLNPNAYGTALGVPALNQNGEMSFVMPGPVPAGWIRITFDVANLGYVDPAFTGFNVELAIQATGQPPVYTSGTILTTGVGNNPRAMSYIEVYLPTAITGAWVLGVTWTNYLTMPVEGWNRSMAIYDITVRHIQTQLFKVYIDSTQYNPLVISQLSVAQPVVGDPQPGAWVAYLNSLGTPASWVHESEIYATTQGADTYNNPSRPASNSLTGSTNWKNDLYVRNPAVAPNVVQPPPPSLNSLSVSPVSSLYNVGQPVTFTANASGTNLRYVWYLPGGTAVTSVGTWSTNIPSSGSISLVARVVDALGSVATGTIPMYVNIPPQINYLSATPNNIAAPFSTTLLANAYDVQGSSFTANWYSGTQFVASGTQVNNFPVTQTQTLTAYVFDSLGGTSTAPLRLVASDAQAPIVSLGNFTSQAIANWPVTLNFSGIAADPDGKGVSTLWTFWDNYATSGYLQAMTGFGTGTLCTSTRVIPAPGVPAGYQLFNLTATNQDGLSTSAAAGVNFVVNQIPQLQSLVVSDPGVVAGTNVYYAASAIDPLGDLLSYTWTFQSINQILYGPNVAMSTNGLAPGSTLGATLKIDDGYGGVITPTVPTVGIFAQGVGALTVTPGSGTYQTGISVAVLGSNTLGQIYYTLDGTDPGSSTTATAYSSPVVIAATAGQTVVFTARSLLTGYAPSPKVRATYTFT